jgi:DNA-binding NarL/FixJ family response regulator
LYDRSVVGRGAERAAVERLVAEAKAGSSGAVVVRGHAGVGKSTLLRHAVDVAGGEMTILRALGIESEAEFAYAGLHQVLRPVLGRLDHLPPPQASALRAAFALSTETVDDPFRVFVAALGLLADAAEERPVLCLVDDAQWLDRPSADALVFAARRLLGDAVAILFAAREEAGHTFAAPGVPDLHLDPLGAAEARELATATLGEGAAPQTVDWLLATADGNPLALVELPRTLTPEQRSGAEPLLGAVRSGTAVVSSYVEQIERLPDDTRLLLLLAAAEETGDRATVTRAALELGVTIEALAAAEERELVSVRSERIDFRHPLVRSAVYGAAAFPARERAHRALAAALSDPADADRRAWHRAAATAGHDEEVARDLESSAQRAIRRGGYATAAAALEKAAALTGGDEQRALRTLAAADAAWLAGEATHALALLADARRRAPEYLEASVVELEARIEIRQGVFTEALSMLVSAARQHVEKNPTAALRLLLEAEEATLYTGDFEAIVEMGELARGIGTIDIDDDDAAAVTALTGIGLLIAGRFDEALPLLGEAIERGRHSDDLNQIVLSTRVAAAVGDDRTSLDLCLRALRLARERGAIGALPRILERAPFYEIRLGHFSDARIHAIEGLRLARELGQEPGIHLCELAHLAGIQGREDEARAYAAEALDRAHQRRSGLLAALSNWALGMLELGLGHPDEAMDALERVIRDDQMTHRVIGWLATPDYVDAAARADRLDAARPRLDAFAEWAAAVAQPWALAAVAHCRGLFATGTEAEAEFHRALELHAHAQRPFEHARTQLALGELLRRDRKRREAREHLRLALAGFERLQAAPWEERARAELRATGETSRRRDPSNIDTLTPQELQIAQLVSAGHSNKDVAAQLFISPRTVEYHLRKIFLKLAITSRADLIRRDMAAAPVPA